MIIFGRFIVISLHSGPVIRNERLIKIKNKDKNIKIKIKNIILHIVTDIKLSKNGYAEGAVRL